MSQHIPPSNIFDLKLLLPPYHEITLPSAGLYSPDVPKTLHVRGFTVKELKHILASGRYDANVFNSTISACIQEPIDVSMLLMQDYNYLIYKIKLLTSGDSHEHVIVCKNTKCQRQFEFTYSLSESAVLTLATEQIPRTKSLTFDRFKPALGNPIIIEVKQLTRKDFNKIIEDLRQATDESTRLNNKVVKFQLTELIKAHIVSIVGLPDQVSKELFVDYLDEKESEAITTAFSELDFGVSGEAIAECPLCKTKTKYIIPFSDLFFL